MTTRSAPDYFVPIIKHGFEVRAVDGQKPRRDLFGPYYIPAGMRTITALTRNGQLTLETELKFKVQSGGDYLLTGEYQRENVMFRVIDRSTQTVVAERRGETFIPSNMPLIIPIPVPVR